MSLIPTFFKSVFSTFYGFLFFGIIFSEILSGCVKQGQTKASTNKNVIKNNPKDNPIEQTQKDNSKAIVIAQTRQKLLKSFYFIACLLYGDEQQKYMALAKQVCLENRLARYSAEFTQLVKSGNRLLRSYLKTAES